MKRILFLMVMFLTASACHDKNKAVVNGQFFGVNNEKIVIEEVLPAGVQFRDSLRTNGEGEFKFEVDFTGRDYPEFYNVRLGNQHVPLLLQAGENVDLSAVGNIYTTYQVKGSEGSQLLRELGLMTVHTARSLDSLSRLINMAAMDVNSFDRVNRLGIEYRKEYIKMKRETIVFVTKNASSLVAIVPLYRPTFNGMRIFDQPNDIVYYKTVADSLEERYPESPYVKSLRNDIRRVDDMMKMTEMIKEAELVDFPDIVMNNAKGEQQKLSSLKGKVIVLAFTSTEISGLKAINRELLDVYNDYKDKDVEVFQVYVDSDKADWVKSVADNKFPWIQVSDLRGLESPALTLYNVKALPAYYIISKDGNVVAVDLEHSKLQADLDKYI